MREIKFRQEKQDGGWHYWGFIENGFISPLSGGSMGGKSYQFTGLLDCNGKEIYEGDIIKDYYEGKCKEREVKNGEITVWEEEPVIRVFRDIRYASEFEGADMRYFKVIGNIYEGLHSGENTDIIKDICQKELKVFKKDTKLAEKQE